MKYRVTLTDESYHDIEAQSIDAYGEFVKLYNTVLRDKPDEWGNGGIMPVESTEYVAIFHANRVKYVMPA